MAFLGTDAQRAPAGVCGSRHGLDRVDEDPSVGALATGGKIVCSPRQFAQPDWSA
jgi:hypothetical protein